MVFDDVLATLVLEAVWQSSGTAIIILPQDLCRKPHTETTC